MTNNKGTLILGIGLGLLGAAIIIYLVKRNQTQLMTAQPMETQFANPMPVQQPTSMQQSSNLSINEMSNNENADVLYKNDEKWEIERADDGSIKSINVKRDVKANK